MLDGGEWLTPRPGRFTLGKENRYPLYRRLGGPPGPVWTGEKNLAPAGIRFPDRAARSESSYFGDISACIMNCPVFWFITRSNNGLKPTFRDYLSVPSLRNPRKWDRLVFPETPSNDSEDGRT